MILLFKVLLCRAQIYPTEPFRNAHRTEHDAVYLELVLVIVLVIIVYALASCHIVSGLALTQ